ncbi:hypothetical protein OROGR_007911 [Orobanche gracilis]
MICSAERKAVENTTTHTVAYHLRREERTKSREETMAVGLTAAGRFQRRRETDGWRFAKAITVDGWLIQPYGSGIRGFEIRRLQQRRFRSGDDEAIYKKKPDLLLMERILRRQSCRIDLLNDLPKNTNCICVFVQ